MQLIGEGGLLTGLTKSVLECAEEEEMSAHLGYDSHDPAGRNGGKFAKWASVSRSCRYRPSARPR
jgi:hypothetical protein